MRSSLRFASILTLALSTTAFAQSGIATHKLSKGYLNAHGITPKNGQAAAAAATSNKNKKNQFHGVAGIDSIANWTDSFTAPGYDYFGNPQTVWPYAMVGTAPETGHTTKIPAPVIPVTVQLL